MSRVNSVALAANILGLDEKMLVGRPNDVEFGPFTFRINSLPLLAGDANKNYNQIRTSTAVTAEGTTDKKLNALDSNRRYWLYLAGFTAMVDIEHDVETGINVSQFMANQFIGMNRNSQNSFDMLAYGSRNSGPTAGGTVAGSAAINVAELPAHFFKYWWILDGESDTLFGGTDVDTTMAADVGCNLWMYGFAVSKSVQSEIASPECGPQALKILAENGPRNLSVRAALLGLD